MRLFVAAWPPEDMLARLATLPRPERPGLRWTTPDQWHVTLRFLGSVAGEDVAAVIEALSGVGAGTGAVRAVAGPAVGRFGRRILHVPVEGLAGVAAAVVEATARFGDPQEDRPFTGHLTLARATGRGPGPDLRPLTGTPVAGEWPVEELTLVESRLHPQGARYDVVERFPLVGRAP